MNSPQPLLVARNLCRRYEISAGAFAKKHLLEAVRGISFTLDRGETLAIVGESGCGKSTLARLVTMIEPPSSGDFAIHGQSIDASGRRPSAALRAAVQIVFQDPYSSLNPRQKIGAIIQEPLAINHPEMPARDRAAEARAMLRRVGLRPEHYDRYPHMFSGGQRQRIAIARALVLRPALLVLDEPVSALDVSVQAQILNLLADLQAELGLAYLFISHNLSVVRHIADRVMVMYLGSAVEYGASQAVFADPRHPYTRALLSATPVADPERQQNRIRLEGELPSPVSPPAGCPFHPRCPVAVADCARAVPPLQSVAGRMTACFRAGG